MKLEDDEYKMFGQNSLPLALKDDRDEKTCIVSMRDRLTGHNTSFQFGDHTNGRED